MKKQPQNFRFNIVIHMPRQLIFVLKISDEEIFIHEYINGNGDFYDRCNAIIKSYLGFDHVVITDFFHCDDKARKIILNHWAFNSYNKSKYLIRFRTRNEFLHPKIHYLISPTAKIITAGAYKNDEILYAIIENKNHALKFPK